jgi:hypothetical protein
MPKTSPGMTEERGHSNRQARVHLATGIGRSGSFAGGSSATSARVRIEPHEGQI